MDPAGAACASPGHLDADRIGRIWGCVFTRSPRAVHSSDQGHIQDYNVGLRDSDNFEHGASGNMLGAVDIATGVVVRAISGVGLGQRVNPKHPVTGATSSDSCCRTGPTSSRSVQDAQKAFPGFICPGWDIALCADGPKILEVNAFGDIDLAQHAYRRGFSMRNSFPLLRERGSKRCCMALPASASVSSNNRAGERKHCGGVVAEELLAKSRPSTIRRREGPRQSRASRRKNEKGRKSRPLHPNWDKPIWARRRAPT